jgi:trans-aconitate 2-methyltransferase
MSELKLAVTEFYNKFSARQIRTGINLRHRTILHYLKKAGLKRHHKVLELGCGIGTLTYLLAGYLSKGQVTGVDISDESIEYARKLNSKNKNSEFLIKDLLELDLNVRYDFIVLPDVLEHIPEEFHTDLLRIVRNHAKDDAVLFIHIPSPGYQDYLATSSPEKLQIIDQPLKAGSVIKTVEEAGFELKKFKSYPLFVMEKDYLRIVFGVKKEWESMTHISYLRMVIKELKSRLIYPLIK